MQPNPLSLQLIKPKWPSPSPPSPSPRGPLPQLGPAFPHTPKPSARPRSSRARPSSLFRSLRSRSAAITRSPRDTPTTATWAPHARSSPPHGAAHAQAHPPAAHRASAPRAPLTALTHLSSLSFHPSTFLAGASARAVSLALRPRSAPWTSPRSWPARQPAHPF